MIRPLNDNVVVQLEQEPDHFTDAPSIIRPDAVKTDHVFRIGKVVAKGPGIWSEDQEKRVPIPVEIGARVVFIKFVATNTETAKAVQHVIGKELALMKAQDLLLEVTPDFRAEDLGQ